MKPKYRIVEGGRNEESGLHVNAIVLDDPRYVDCIFSFFNISFDDKGEDEGILAEFNQNVLTSKDLSECPEIFNFSQDLFSVICEDMVRLIEMGLSADEVISQMS